MRNEQALQKKMAKVTVPEIYFSTVDVEEIDRKHRWAPSTYIRTPPVHTFQDRARLAALLCRDTGDRVMLFYIVSEWKRLENMMARGKEDVYRAGGGI